MGGAALTLRGVFDGTCVRLTDPITDLKPNSPVFVLLLDKIERKDVAALKPSALSKFMAKNPPLGKSKAELDASLVKERRDWDAKP